MAELAVAASLVQAYSTIQGGKHTDAMYKAQADQTLVQARSQVLQSRQQALNHREDGIEVLVQMKRNAATINARAGAGMLDPFSGSTGNIMTVNLNQGFQDFTTTRDNRFIAEQNQIIIQKSAEHQAAQYRAAGKHAKKSAMFSAITSVAMAGASYGMMGGFGGAGGAGAAPAGGANLGGGFGMGGMGGSWNPMGKMGTFGRIIS
ncbi:MAG: hypothetical protein OSB69_18660 [Alphaproteobacteria bacterium]|nr:hypothetical protein [Alphaproteobacteria bacterium]